MHSEAYQTTSSDEHQGEHDRDERRGGDDQSRDTATTSTEARRGGTGQIRVALVNDYEIVLRGLHAMLAPYSERITVVEHDTTDTPDAPADIALIDTYASRRSTLARARAIKEEGRVRHVVFYTWDAPDEFLRTAREIGVDGVIAKTSNARELVDALERVAAGERVGLDTVVKGLRSRPDDAELTVREREVLALLALGLSNAEIAHQLFVSVDTVKTHLRRIFAKLGVNNRTQAAMRAVSVVNGAGATYANSSPG